MLKIKDDVDLKALEKYGLKKKVKYYANNKISIDIMSKYILVNNVGYSPYGDFIPNKNMYNSQRLYIGNVLYDLIKDNLVEKIKEE